MATQQMRLIYQMIGLAANGVLFLVWTFTSRDMAIRYGSAVMVGISIWFIGTKYLQYRQKYPR